MDNLTHSLAGALLGQMGLKRASRFGMAACILGANAPDIDVFAPLFLPVDNIAFHRGPTHAIFGLPFMAAGVVALLWLVDRFKSRGEGALPFRPGPLFLVALIAVASHPFLDWLTTYAVDFFAPFGSGRWYSANAVFIIDWVYWLLLIGGVAWSARRYKRNLPGPERPAIVAGLALLAYIAGNVIWSQVAQRRTAAVLRAQGIEPTLIVTSPPPFAFWERTIAWRSRERYGGGDFGPGGLRLDPRSAPLRLDHPALQRAREEQRIVRSFLFWSRMPIVIQEADGRLYLSDQRYYGPIRSAAIPPGIRSAARRSSFLVPLDTPSKP